MNSIPQCSLQEIDALGGMYAGYRIGTDYYIICIGEDSTPVGYSALGSQLPPELADQADEAVDVDSFDAAVKHAVEGHLRTIAAIENNEKNILVTAGCVNYKPPAVSHG